MDTDAKLRIPTVWTHGSSSWWWGMYDYVVVVLPNKCVRGPYATMLAWECVLFVGPTFLRILVLLVVVVVPVMSHPPLPSRTQRHVAVWPRQTAPSDTPIPSYSKRRRALCPRQTIADMSSVITAETQCQLDSGNDVISWYPTAGVSVAQEQYASFVCMSS